MTDAERILKMYPADKIRRQKKKFREAVFSYLQKLGYSPAAESGTFGKVSILVGDPAQAEFFITAPLYERIDQNLSFLTVLLILENLQENLKPKVAVLLFDGKTPELKTFRKSHESDGKFYFAIHLSSVGTGDFLELIPGQDLKKESEKLDLLFSLSGIYGNKKIAVSKKGRLPGKYRKFSDSVLIHGSKTQKQEVNPKDDRNINLLQAAVLTLISRSAVK